MAKRRLVTLARCQLDIKPAAFLRQPHPQRTQRPAVISGSRPPHRGAPIGERPVRRRLTAVADLLTGPFVKAPSAQGEPVRLTMCFTHAIRPIGGQLRRGLFRRRIGPRPSFSAVGGPACPGSTPAAQAGVPSSKTSHGLYARGEITTNRLQRPRRQPDRRDLRRKRPAGAQRVPVLISAVRSANPDPVVSTVERRLFCDQCEGHLVICARGVVGLGQGHPVVAGLRQGRRLSRPVAAVHRRRL